METRPGMDFPMGDLVIRCLKCGNRKVLEEGVTDGRGIYLFNRHDSAFGMSCPICEIGLEIRLEPSIEIPTAEEELKEINEEDNEELQTSTPVEEVVQ
jgi:hypothetical protein